MSSPEVESFEVTEEDLADEFNPNRKRARMTKNKATYGIWADRDSDDERPSFGGKKSSATDYTSAIGFVSGGFKKTAKEEQEDAEKDSDSDGEFDRARIPVGFGKHKGKPQKFGGNMGSKQFAGETIGHWEKHTRGIGQKLLSKMGHVAGKGLGKTLQGIQTPVEAVKRKGKATLGYYGTGSERSERSLQDFPVVDSEEEEDKEFQDQLHQWKSKPGADKKKPKYRYKTADDVIATGGRRPVAKKVEHAKVKVIDMTGREQKVFSGYHALSSRHDKPDEEEELYSETPVKKVFDMPELLHNLNILVDMSEEEIIQNDRQLRHEKDLIVNLKFEHEKMTELCDQEEKQVNKLKQVLEIIENIEARTKEDSKDPISLEECAQLFSTLRDQFYEEFKMYDLAAMAMAMAFPLVKKYFSTWNPLRAGTLGISAIRCWRDVLEDTGRRYGNDQSNMDPYQKLIWDGWMPSLRSAIVSWDVRQPEPLIEFLENWMPVLPTWIFENIKTQLIMPKLQREVDNWNPLTDTVPIHAWIHPWLPLMGKKLEILYPPIRHKLQFALTNWHPSDPSAKMILEPWKTVFSPGHLSAFLTKNIIPKLALCLSEFVINPHQQHLDGWNWAMAWKDMMPSSAVATLLDKHFFPKWTQVLCTWLSNNPNYDEVTKWYTGWKSMIPEDVLAQPAIKDHFSQALSIMNRAVSANLQPGARENVAYLLQTERHYGMEPSTKQADSRATERASEPARSTPLASLVPTRFRELIERKAEENGIIFMPIPGKKQEAKQVFRFGKLQVYIDTGVAFVQETSGQWNPVSLNTLLDKAKSA